MDPLSSHILVTSRFDAHRERLEREVRERGARLIPLIREGSVKVEDVALLLEKAHLASEEHQVILLAGEQFSDVVQNKLLKVIEEPPPRKSFILLFRSKAAILPTIRSRLPIRILDELEREESLDLDIKRLDVEKVYDFVQHHNRLKSDEARRLAERLLKEALASGAYDLDERSLDLFRDAVRALDMGSPVPFVLTALLLKLLARRKRRQPFPPQKGT
jgi:DNA polymerase-3 subunit delta'